MDDRSRRSGAGALRTAVAAAATGGDDDADDRDVDNVVTASEQ
jgi:hypothetical protein